MLIPQKWAQKYTLRLIPIAILILVLSTAPVHAHDYYFLPEHFFLKKGDTLKVHLFVGDNFARELERPYQKYITRKLDFYTQGASDNLMLTAKDSAYPLYWTPVSFSGLGLLSTERNYAHIELLPGKFQRYLKEEGITDIPMDSISWPRTKVRERYTRYLKTIVCADQPDKSRLYKKRLGSALEIILLNNPYALKTTKTLRVKVLFRGKSLRQHTVLLSSQTPDIREQSLRTDKHGIAELMLSGSGVYLVHLVHMIPSSEPKEADFESFWASYSFGVAR